MMPLRTRTSRLPPGDKRSERDINSRGGLNHDRSNERAQLLTQGQEFTEWRNRTVIFSSSRRLYSTRFPPVQPLPRRSSPSYTPLTPFSPVFSPLLPNRSPDSPDCSFHPFIISFSRVPGSPVRGVFRLWSLLTYYSSLIVARRRQSAI